MAILGLIFIASGIFLMRYGFQKKIYTDTDGKSLKDVAENMLNKDANAAFTQSMKYAGKGYLKMISILGGIGLILLGIMFFFLGLI